MSHEPETLHERFGSSWARDAFRPNSSLAELYPKAKAYVIREEDGRRALDVMAWDVLGGQAAWPMTNVRNLGLPQWRALAASPEKRCLVPLTEFCEWTPDKHQVGEGKPVKGEMWFAVPGTADLRRGRLLATDREGRRLHDGHLRPERARRADPSEGDGDDPTRGGLGSMADRKL